MYFSIVIPVYNRPDEVDELLESLTFQTEKNFEVIIVEDGSSISCEDVAKKYKSQLSLEYFYKPNSGPGQSRNYGAERSKGDYIIFFDSDCIIPAHYIETVSNTLLREKIDAYGGPDSAHESFTDTQKAINYSMTSFFTTGGIRGGTKSLEKFMPRSFNMGFSKAVFEKTKGFSKMRFGEDIDMSLRILENGFTTKLISNAYVFHKRRTRFKTFFKQVSNSGIARINLYKRHPQSLKAVHFLPSLFTIGSIFFLCLTFVFGLKMLLPLLFFSVLIFTDSLIKNKSITVTLLSILASFIQLYGYGYGFILAVLKRLIFKQDEFAVFERNFYK